MYLLQRKGRFGTTLGKTTGWIHRADVKKHAVEELGGCKYVEINDSGLVIERNGTQTTLEVDTVVICAGQEPHRAVYDEITAGATKGTVTEGGTKEKEQKVFMIGGCYVAGELDAKRAIDQGMRLAAVVETAKSGEVFDAPDTTNKFLKFIEGFTKTKK